MEARKEWKNNKYSKSKLIVHAKAIIKSTVNYLSKKKSSQTGSICIKWKEVSVGQVHLFNRMSNLKIMILNTNHKSLTKRMTIAIALKAIHQIHKLRSIMLKEMMRKKMMSKTKWASIKLRLIFNHLAHTLHHWGQ